MIRILFIQHGMGYGGATKSLLLMQKVLYKQFKLYTITVKVSKKNRAIIHDFEKYSEVIEYSFPSIHSYSAGTISTNDFKEIKKYYPKEIIEFINAKKIDIVHINSTNFSYLLMPIKNKTKAKIVVHFREMLPNKDADISKYIINNHIKYADAIIAISHNEIQYYPKTKKNTIIPNPHEFNLTDRFNKKKDNIELVIGMCASFIEYKGHLDFLKMASIINKNNKYSNKIKFKVIGYPKLSKSVKEITKYILNYGYKVKFDKNVKKLRIKNLEIIRYTLDIYEELNDIDIYVRPDNTGHPWGRDIIEAMALKKPIVATGTSDFFIENRKNGYLISPRNPKAMAEKVNELINNRNKRKEFGENGYEKVRRMCDIEEYGKKIEAIYRKII